MKKPRGMEPLQKWAERASVIDQRVRSILNLYGDPEIAAPVIYTWLFGGKPPERYLVGAPSPQEMGGGSNKLFSDRYKLEDVSDDNARETRREAEERARAIQILYAEYQKKRAHQPHLRATFYRKFARQFRVSERTIKRDLQRNIPR